MTSTTEKTPNFTAAQEQIIRDAQPEGGKFNLTIATAIAAREDMRTADGSPRTVRSVLAKINRMELPYERKGPVTKTGEPVVKKADLVKRIAAIVSGNLDGLEKAPLPALKEIAAFVEAARASEAEEADEAASG